MSSLNYTTLFIALLSLFMGCLNFNTQQSNPFVEYKRSGGFAGLNDHLILNENGTASLTRKSIDSEITVSETNMTQLRSMLESVDFRRLEKEYLASRQGADYIEYQIIYNGHAVRTQDTAIPEPLQPIIDLLNTICEYKEN